MISLRTCASRRHTRPSRVPRPRARFAVESLEPRLVLSAYYVSPTGSDSAPGTLDAPWKTLQHALGSVAAGDEINLRAGSYSGGVYIGTPDLTIRSYPGERAAIVAPTDGSVGNVLYFGAPGGKAVDLDLSGGSFYGVKFDQGRGLVDGCKITGTGYFGIKVVPGADHVTISRTEVAHTGLLMGGGGIDDVNGDYLTIRDCYIHDTAGDGIHVKGGAIGVVIERNRVEGSQGTGITIGQSTGTQFMDPSQNPDYYEIIAPVVRNNIVRETDYAGVAIYAAQRPQVYNNTLIDTALVGQGSLYLTYMTHDLGPADPAHLTMTTDPSIVNNLVTRTAGGVRPLVFITANAFTGTLTLDHNRYWNGGGDATFWDERSGREYYGTFATWPGHIGAESGSTLGDPSLDADGHLVSGSPCIDAGRTLGAVTDDVDRDPRAGAFDIGADEFAAVVNRPPLANVDTAATVRSRPVTIAVLANDSDPDGERPTVTGVTTAAHGTVVLNADGTVTYTAARGFTGDDTFSYTISDGRGGTAMATVTVTVNRK